MLLIMKMSTRGKNGKTAWAAPFAPRVFTFVVGDLDLCWCDHFLAHVERDLGLCGEAFASQNNAIALGANVHGGHRFVHGVNLGLAEELLGKRADGCVNLL